MLFACNSSGCDLLCIPGGGNGGNGTRGGGNGCNDGGGGTGGGVTLYGFLSTSGGISSLILYGIPVSSSYNIFSCANGWSSITIGTGGTCTWSLFACSIISFTRSCCIISTSSCISSVLSALLSLCFCIFFAFFAFFSLFFALFCASKCIVFILSGKRTVGTYCILFAFLTFCFVCLPFNLFNKCCFACFG